MKQRVAIARGMATEPKIPLMDEPFAALDALTHSRMPEELLQLWGDTKFTILFVTHSIPEAIRAGSRILLAVLALVWEVYARWLNNPLLLPIFSDTVKAIFNSTRLRRTRAPQLIR